MTVIVLLVGRDSCIICEQLERSVSYAELVVCDLRACREKTVCTTEHIPHIEIYVMISKIFKATCIHDVSLIEPEVYYLGLLRSYRRYIHAPCEHLSAVHLYSPMEDIS